MMKNRQQTRRASDDETIIVSIDPGSQTIKALMAVVEQNGTLTYLSGGEFPSAGIHEGMVSAPERAEAALATALDALEAASDTRIQSAFVSIGGPRIHSQIAHGETTVVGNERLISMQDVNRAIAAAKKKIAQDERSETLHVIPSGYTIDNVSGIPNPLEMVGFELAVDTCIISAPLTVTQNMLRSLVAAGAEPDNLIAAPLAAAESVRKQSEPGLPIAVVDIGAQTTGFTLYAENAVVQCESLPIGGDTITREIAHKLRQPIEVAENLKLQYATCLPSDVDEDDLIELEPLSGEDDLLPASLLAECTASGARELANALLRQLQPAQRQRLRPAMMLLTGGGAELQGLDTLLTSQLHIPVLVARPEGIVDAPPEVREPAFAVATGLLLLGARRRLRATPPPRSNSAQFMAELWRRLFGPRGHRRNHPPRR